jgi:hypothetical protein
LKQSVSAGFSIFAGWLERPGFRTPGKILPGGGGLKGPSGKIQKTAKNLSFISKVV